ncbi:DegT/DnrJ/EryC1/StrS family aminotransferase [Escherichia coli]|nr:DegT/DnrJ/EryC1/StrS family aminotransferase [Escherichia coli]EFW8097375.1 DegT/DnrJ/EryC1/StrS family aminotransferase [Shigella sonnei]EHY1704300.1 DegT/DnrJ/EryC1/StrS family aminotransferase [Escherichia coli O21]AAO39694.1 putative dTDP-4-amino-4,6-dideoxyglucose aminotransferase [Escherichia coli]AFC91522.1 VioA [Escherichia coli]AFC91536.1 VioA [Escherichia coli]
MEKPIFVTQPNLPPLEEFIPYLEIIWQNKQFTNNGPMHQKLEKKLCEFLGVEYISLFNNGTIALITAVQALGVKGEVITTPYSFVATAHSLVLNGLKPVFVDIDSKTLNIDPRRIEEAITPETQAIMPVHCYGNPCDTQAIADIAQKYNLKVIYDAAHAFGVEDDDGSVLRHGDLSVLSFHATKVFSTFEGGAIVCNSKEMKEKIDRLKNFGYIDETNINIIGSNGKMSEVNAAFGLLQLEHMDTFLRGRMNADMFYRQKLKDITGISIVIPSGQKISNFSYFPILVESDFPLSRDELFNYLKNQNIFARRYFYPVIPDFQAYLNVGEVCDVKNAREIASKVLCLPMHAELSSDILEYIVSTIREIK